MLVAALELRAAEVVGGEIQGLDGGPHRPVEDEDALGDGLLQGFQAAASDQTSSGFCSRRPLLFQTPSHESGDEGSPQKRVPDFSSACQALCLRRTGLRAARRAHLADAVVARVGDVDVAVRTDGDAIRGADWYLHGEALAAVRLTAVPGEGRDLRSAPTLRTRLLSVSAMYTLPHRPPPRRAESIAIAFCASPPSPPYPATPLPAIGLDQAGAAVDAADAIVLAVCDVEVRRIRGLPTSSQAARIDGCVDGAAPSPFPPPTYVSILRRASAASPPRPPASGRVHSRRSAAHLAVTAARTRASQ